MSRWIIPLSFSALSGMAIGMAYFGILWLTVRRVHLWRHPGFVFMMSLLGRLILLGSALFLLAGHGWASLAAGVVGLLAVRAFLVRRIGAKS